MDEMKVTMPGRRLLSKRNPWIAVTFFLALSLFYVIRPSWAGEAENVEQQVEYIAKSYGIFVHCQKDYYEKEQKEVLTFGHRANPEQVERAMKFIMEFLETYPVRVLRRSLGDIYILEDVFLRGVQAGGLNCGSAIFITISPRIPDSFVIGALHSEYSSILMKKYPFPATQWMSLNPSGFQYVGTGRGMALQAQKSGTDLTKQSPALLEAGFLLPYSQSTMENDFNMIVHWLFARRDELKALAEQHPRIKQKMQLAMDFYKSIDTGFDFD